MLRSMLDIDEHIIWEGRPDKVTYVIGSPFVYLFALIWGAFDSVFIFVFLREGGINEMATAFMVPFFLFHLAPVWFAVFGPIYRAINWKYIEYAITDKRIYIASGIIGRDVKLVEFSEVRAPGVQVGMIEKLRNCGSVRLTPFSSARSSGLRRSIQSGTLLHISDPYTVFKKIKQMSLDIQADISYPNAMRPDANPGYNTNYEPKE
ncbi:MAG: PH domain-containing protein [Clostridiales bacterium]|nr:PH domain-containing protein [Clostridiales bacterium]